MNTTRIKKLIDGLDRPYVLVLIGPPLSGKTTFVEKVLEKGTFEHISTDKTLLEFDKKQDGDYDRAWREADWKKVRKTVKDQMRACNEEKRNAVIDFTNLRSKRRQSSLSFFDKDFYKIAVIFPILEVDEYMERNRQRMITEKKSISKATLKNMFDQCQPIDKKIEKYDKVINL